MATDGKGAPSIGQFEALEDPEILSQFAFSEKEIHFLMALEVLSVESEEQDPTNDLQGHAGQVQLDS